jgi:energy-coupling factor transporter ATP-binding protein EcfA2
MNSNFNYKGTRWFKCDLHLHTVASQCFEDKTVTPEQWVDRAIEQGLNCVAITDHNTGASVDDIKEAAKDKMLTVFPGVEITCDSAKVHLLILFDVTKTSADIRDFLVRADIKADDFGKQTASTVKSIFEIADLANKDSAMVIPAHINEYNGLGDVSVDNLKIFYSKNNINAVQVVHKEFLNNTLQVSNNDELKTMLNDYYGNPNPAIDDSTIKKWFTSTKYALEANVALLTFSDNPHGAQNPKHGLGGIGESYTWIKMDVEPSLEGLRQAFLLPDFRVKNKFDSPDNPYIFPDVWIKSITINNATITDTSSPLKINFSPQLNTLIGGRGSGKSSILRFIRGVFNRTADINALHEILRDHNDFYKREEGRPKKGVLQGTTTIEIEFVRNNILHKIVASEIYSTEKQKLVIEKFIDETSSWEIISDEGYLDFFEFDHYSQKQIYEIAQQPNALRERIDKAIDSIAKLNSEREQIKNLFLEKSVGIRTSDQIIAGKGKIETRIKDLDESIKKLQKSGIASILTDKEKFSKDEEIIFSFKKKIEEKENDLNRLIQDFELLDIDYSSFTEIHKQILEPISKVVIDGISALKSELEKLNTSLIKLKDDYQNSIDGSAWRVDYDKNIEDFTTKKDELELEGINDIGNFEKLTEEKVELEKKIEIINAKSIVRETDVAERLSLQNEYLEICKQITLIRRDFVSQILQDGKVKINIKQFRDKNDFEVKLRHILQREDHLFVSDIDKLVELCFTGNVEQKIEEVRDIFLKIRRGEEVSNNITGFFINLVKDLTDAQIDEIELLLPEDEIEVQYKPTATSPFKSLSTASAGQKTTAILTFILSYGKVPLILDQPEDDLDNRLVYELIVDRLKQAKENRQLIVVTHNANIPVNGDAEYIVSMDTESKTLKVIHKGTVEQPEIKTEICDVMEGGELAFNMRSKRYKQIE